MPATVESSPTKQQQQPPSTELSPRDTAAANAKQHIVSDTELTKNEGGKEDQLAEKHEEEEDGDDNLSQADTEPLPFDEDGQEDSDIAMEEASAIAKADPSSRMPAADDLDAAATLTQALAGAQPPGAGQALFPDSEVGGPTPSGSQRSPSASMSPQKMGGDVDFSDDSDLTDESDEGPKNHEEDSDEDDAEGEDGEDDASSLSDASESGNAPRAEVSKVEQGQRDESGDSAEEEEEDADDEDAEADMERSDNEEYEEEEEEARLQARRSPAKRTSRYGSIASPSQRRHRALDTDEEAEADDETGAEDRDEEEDEAAMGLAALTGQPPDSVAAGLDGLAALATADNAQQQALDSAPDATGLAGLPLKSRTSRAQRADEQASSELTSEPEDEAAAGEQEEAAAAAGDLALLASMAQANATKGSLVRPGPLPEGLTADGGLDASLPASAATSRQVTPQPIEDEADDANKDADLARAEDEEVDEAAAKENEEAPDAVPQAAEDIATAAGTPVPGEHPEHEEDTSTDEAALRRQEAMEALTKIEIGFAMLRDRLYVERIEEVGREGEMIYDGTHPELIHLTKLIEARRERRLRLAQLWFEQQEQQFERVAKAEEATSWSGWRAECADLRRDMIDEVSRKKRKLDREKRTLDAPRPARRHQVFETELVRNPDVEELAVSPRKKRTTAPKRRAAEEAQAAPGDYVAFPDLRGLDDSNVWMDMERMGIRADFRMAHAAYSHYYRPEELQAADMYAMYGDGAVPGPSYSTPYGTPTMHHQPAAYGTPHGPSHQARHGGMVQAYGEMGYPDGQLQRGPYDYDVQSTHAGSPYPPEMYSSGPSAQPYMHRPPSPHHYANAQHAVQRPRHMELHQAEPMHFDGSPTSSRTSKRAQQASGHQHPSGHAATANRMIQHGHQASPLPMNQALSPEDVKPFIANGLIDPTTPTGKGSRTNAASKVVRREMDDGPFSNPTTAAQQNKLLQPGQRSPPSSLLSHNSASGTGAPRQQQPGSMFGTGPAAHHLGSSHSARQAQTNGNGNLANGSGPGTMKQAAEMPAAYMPPDASTGSRYLSKAQPSASMSGSNTTGAGAGASTSSKMSLSPTHRTGGLPLSGTAPAGPPDSSAGAKANSASTMIGKQPSHAVGPAGAGAGVGPPNATNNSGPPPPFHQAGHNHRNPSAGPAGFGPYPH